MASKRQKLIDAIVERMRRIRTTNTYLTSGGDTRNFETDLGLNVNDWQVNYNEEDLPALSVCDTVADVDLPGDNLRASKQKHVLPVLLRIFQASDTRASDLRKMMADVVAAIGEDIFWIVEDKALAMVTRITKAGIIVPSENFEIGGAAIEMEITYLVNSFEF